MLPRRLETARLQLEATRAEHAEGLWEATQRSLPELVATMAWAPDASFETAQTFAVVMEQKWEQQTDWSFTIFHERQAAGTVTLMRYQALFALCEIGYWLRSDLCGRGLMTEAAAAVCDFGFDRMRVHRIELRAAVANRPSQRVAEKLGFAREARLKEAGWVQTGFQDMFLYALLSSQRPRADRDSL